MLGINDKTSSYCSKYMDKTGERIISIECSTNGIYDSNTTKQLAYGFYVIIAVAIK